MQYGKGNVSFPVAIVTVLLIKVLPCTATVAHRRLLRYKLVLQDRLAG